jgi:hypothetical protein
MTSTTGNVDNQTGVPLTLSVGGVSHGADPTIEISRLDSGTKATVFIAMSDGAGVDDLAAAWHRPSSRTRKR